MSFLGKSKFPLPSDLHLKCLDWLTQSEAIETAKVCKAWRSDCQNEKYWFSQCRGKNIGLENIGAVAYGIESRMDFL